jgi:hypothetical protein
MESDDSDTDGAHEIEELPLADRFEVARHAFEDLMAQDFPDFDREQYATEKAEAEGIDTATVSSRIWSEVRSMSQRLDITGDGKIGLDDAQMAARLAAQRVGESWSAARSLKAEDVKRATAAAGSVVTGLGRKITGADFRGVFEHAAHRVKDAAQHVDRQSFQTSGHTLLQIGKTGVGIQGIQDRRAALKTKAICEEYAAAAETMTDVHRAELNARIEEFGTFRLNALHDTLGRFLILLKALNQHNKVKEYELLAGVGLDTRTLESMGNLDMTVSQSLGAAAATGVLGAVAVMGTPAVVSGAVIALATASTGTAISTLSGAAANSAILAWLGGGSLAVGGGGMATGTVVLAGITAGTTAGVAVLAAGILVSTHYAKKLTEAKTFEKDTALAVASLENAWAVMDGIGHRLDELSDVTGQLKARLAPELDRLEALIPAFDPADSNDAAVFNKCGLLVKTMVELAQTPLLDDDGNLSDESLTITTEVTRVLNTEV